MPKWFEPKSTVRNRGHQQSPHPCKFQTFLLFHQWANQGSLLKGRCTLCQCIRLAEGTRITNYKTLQSPEGTRITNYKTLQSPHQLQNTSKPPLRARKLYISDMARSQDGLQGVAAALAGPAWREPRRQTRKAEQGRRTRVVIANNCTRRAGRESERALHMPSQGGLGGTNFSHSAMSQCCTSRNTHKAATILVMLHSQSMACCTPRHITTSCRQSQQPCNR